jgi:fumarylacetoacetase
LLGESEISLQAMTQQMIDSTHDPKLRSWVTSANNSESAFPIQNLPFGRFREIGNNRDVCIGVAIGDQILDLRAANLIDTGDMNALMAIRPDERRALRLAISAGLAQGSEKKSSWQSALLPQFSVEMVLPCHIGDYTDFYSGIHHATAVGKLFRPDNPLLPNYKWMPIGYHGRSSSIIASGSRLRRPLGQLKGTDDAPVLGASKRLDYELELGFLVGTGNELGESIPIDKAEDHLFGLTLLNDWSARDIQSWEYQPLGPFLSKNFATTLSPWIVTTEALAPFRSKFTRPDGDPQPLRYLDSPRNREIGALDITLEVWLQTLKMREAGLPAHRLTRGSSASAAYWTAAQLITHHAVNGCKLQAGDLLGSGTLSGPKPEEAGSLLELTCGGKNPITLPNGEQRTFLEDGDTVTLRGYCERDGAVRIGLGECTGTVVGAASVE